MNLLSLHADMFFERQFIVNDNNNIRAYSLISSAVDLLEVLATMFSTTLRRRMVVK